MNNTDHNPLLDIVPENQPMDPETEDLLYADALVDGMMVLIEPTYRYDDKHNTFDCLRIYNRWCEVTQLRFEEDNRVYFIGLYADGDKVIRSTAHIHGWIVKKDSMPVVDETKHSTGPFAGMAKNLSPSLTTLSGRPAVIRYDEPMTESFGR